MFPRNNVSSPIGNVSSPINNVFSPIAPYDPNQGPYYFADFDGTHIDALNGSRDAATDNTADTSPNNVRWSFISHVQSSGAGSPVASSTTLPKTALNKPGGPSRTSWPISTNNASSTAVASVLPGDHPGEPSKGSSEPDDSGRPAKPDKPEERKRVRIDFLQTHNVPPDPSPEWVPWLRHYIEYRCLRIRPHRYAFPLDWVHDFLPEFNEETAPNLWQEFDTPVHKKHWHSVAKRPRTATNYLTWAKKTIAEPKDPQKMPRLGKFWPPPKPRRVRFFRQFRKYWIRKSYPIEDETNDNGEGGVVVSYGGLQPPEAPEGGAGANGPNVAPSGPQQAPTSDGNGAGQKIDKGKGKAAKTPNDSRGDTRVNGSDVASSGPQQGSTSDGNRANPSGTAHQELLTEMLEVQRNMANAGDLGDGSSLLRRSVRDASELDSRHSPPPGRPEHRRRSYNPKSRGVFLRCHAWNSPILPMPAKRVRVIRIVPPPATGVLRGGDGTPPPEAEKVSDRVSDHVSAGPSGTNSHARRDSDSASTDSMAIRPAGSQDTNSHLTPISNEYVPFGPVTDPSGTHNVPQREVDSDGFSSSSLNDSAPSGDLENRRYGGPDYFDGYRSIEDYREQHPLVGGDIAEDTGGRRRSSATVKQALSKISSKSSQTKAKVNTWGRPWGRDLPSDGPSGTYRPPGRAPAPGPIQLPPPFQLPRPQVPGQAEPPPRSRRQRWRNRRKTVWNKVKEVFKRG